MAEVARVTVLISGRGSNLEALLRNAKRYKITDILTDNPSAAGLLLAKEFKVESHIINPSSYSSKGEFRKALDKTLHSIAPDLIALAGFMRIVPKSIVDKFYGKIINIHPSLLPALPGLDTHKRALSSRLKKHGCTVHFVDSGIDTGPIIAQAECDLEERDTEETLAARVLSWEHRLYPWCLEKIATRQIYLQDNSVQISKLAREEASKLGFLIPKEAK